MVPKGGEYESDTQNLDICETRKLYVSKSNFANMIGQKFEILGGSTPLRNGFRGPSPFDQRRPDLRGMSVILCDLS